MKVFLVHWSNGVTGFVDTVRADKYAINETGDVTFLAGFKAVGTYAKGFWYKVETKP